jgi:hypothetical protein
MLYKTPTEAEQSKFLSSINIEAFPTNNYVFTYNESSVSIDMRKLTIESDTYSNNYGGQGGSTLSIEGMPFIEISILSFSANGNNIPDLYAGFSTIYSNIQSIKSITNTFSLNKITDTFLASYSNKMKTILNIDMTNKLILSGLSFDNNWVIDQGVSTPVSHSLLLSNVYKSFSCVTCKFNNNGGISKEPLFSTSDYFVNFTSVTEGVRKQLVNFDRYYFSSCTLSGDSEFK